MAVARPRALLSLPREQKSSSTWELRENMIDLYQQTADLMSKCAAQPCCEGCAVSEGWQGCLCCPLPQLLPATVSPGLGVTVSGRWLHLCGTDLGVTCVPGRWLHGAVALLWPCAYSPE